MRFARFGIAPWTALFLIWLTSGCALAAPPSDDVFTGATTVDSDPVFPTLAITVDPVDALLLKAGVAIISGTYTCTNADFVDIFVAVNQSFGRFTVVGSGSNEFHACNGEPQGWAVSVVPDNGEKFSGGMAMASVLASACTNFGGCAPASAQQTVQLRPNGVHGAP